ncbi:ComEC/Rec2 family competence protein [uncultured Amnibacterium sp.]|uniref:ComEC/Rec2 family competence protein n=1 Tax=uncultured Amnibacterium sp. TaxID=1631851 RepID=UPI0035C95F07
MTAVNLGSGSNVLVDVLDVGHGSCAVVLDGQSTLVIDTGVKSYLLEYLAEAGRTSIDALIISHADSDHLRGLVALLGAGIDIKHMYWNTDSVKGSQLWRSVVFELNARMKTGQSVQHHDAIQGRRIHVAHAQATIEVVSPDLEINRLGPGQTDSSGDLITSNSASVVARIDINGSPFVLATGDLDEVGWRHLVASGRSVRAEYLIAPHHGGRVAVGAAQPAVSAAILAAVRPSAVVISNGRTAYANPRHDVIQALKLAPTRPYIACTQLSERCSNMASSTGPVSTLMSAGHARGHSCAGTVRLRFGLKQDPAEFSRSDHQSFITTEAPTALCR